MASIFAVLLIVFVAMNLRYFYNCAAGPFVLSKRDLQKISNPQARLRYYVTVSGGKAIATPFLWEEKRNKFSVRDNSSKITAFFLLLPTKAGFLLVKTPALTGLDRSDMKGLVKYPDDTGSDSYTGELAALDPDLEMKVKDSLEQAQHGMEKRLLPFMLVHTDSFKSSLPVCVLCTTLLAAGLAFHVIRALFFRSD